MVPADGDRLRVRLHVADVRWLRNLALRQGGTLRVVEPRWVAEDVASAARAALEAYVRV